QQQQKERVRVYALARELNLDSKDLVELCRQQGIDVKNQLSSLDPQHCDLIKLLVKKGTKAGGVATAPLPPTAAPSLPSNLDTRIRVLPPQRKRETETAAPAAPLAAPVSPPAEVAPAASPPPSEPMPISARAAEPPAPRMPVEHPVKPTTSEPPRV